MSGNISDDQWEKLFVFTFSLSNKNYTDTINASEKDISDNIIANLNSEMVKDLMNGIFDLKFRVMFGNHTEQNKIIILKYIFKNAKEVCKYICASTIIINTLFNVKSELLENYDKIIGKLESETKYFLYHYDTIMMDTKIKLINDKVNKFGTDTGMLNINSVSSVSVYNSIYIAKTAYNDSIKDKNNVGLIVIHYIMDKIYASIPFYILGCKSKNVLNTSTIFKIINYLTTEDSKITGKKNGIDMHFILADFLNFFKLPIQTISSAIATTTATTPASTAASSSGASGGAFPDLGKNDKDISQIEHTEEVSKLYMAIMEDPDIKSDTNKKDLVSEKILGVNCTIEGLDIKESTEELNHICHAMYGKDFAATKNTSSNGKRLVENIQSDAPIAPTEKIYTLGALSAILDNTTVGSNPAYKPLKDKLNDIREPQTKGGYKWGGGKSTEEFEKGYQEMKRILSPKSTSSASTVTTGGRKKVRIARM